MTLPPTVLWPLDRLGEAVHALARDTGLPTTCREALSGSGRLSPEQVDPWIRAAAACGGLQAVQATTSLSDIPALIRRGSPLIVRVGGQDSGGFLTVRGGTSSWASVLGPDLQRHRIALSALCERMRAPFEVSSIEAVEQMLRDLPIPAARRATARSAILAEHVAGVRIGSCWLLRLPPGSPIRDEVRETRLGWRLGGLVTAHLSQYALFIVSWWLLGRAAMDGTIDAGWLTGWLLLIISLVPFRLMASWVQSGIATTAGTLLRRRLLRGAMNIDRAYLQQHGAGQLFGLVLESETIESLGLTGGMAAVLALVELAAAGVVLWSGGSHVLVTLLGVWTGVTLALGLRYGSARRTWTAERLHMTDRLLEAMRGHRTRLAQQAPASRHDAEDVDLSRYVENGREMDRANVALAAFVPRGWLLVALVGLAPLISARTSPAAIAIAVGGILLAHRSIRRLSLGLAHLSGAGIATEALSPLARAAHRHEASAHPSMVVADTTAASDTQTPALYMRDVSFAYEAGQPVLDRCTLTVAKGARLLLEGPSGMGKTTLVSLLAGLETPDSGLLLVEGLDRSVLGTDGWRRRIVMAPQAHDNHLLSGTLAFNLLLGRRWPALSTDLAEAEQICRELGLGDLLDRLPVGLHQLVGDTGWQLSQGERTRVFLARALLQKPDVLVLDESFSALDPENVDRTVRCVLRRAQTVLAVAHV